MQEVNHNESSDQEYSQVEQYLIREIGFDGWIQFCSRFGGSRHYIPRSPSIVSRDNEIRRVFNDILSVVNCPNMEIVYEQFSRRYNLSKRQIKRITSNEERIIS